MRYARGFGIRPPRTTAQRVVSTVLGSLVWAAIFGLMIAVVSIVVSR